MVHEIPAEWLPVRCETNRPSRSLPIDMLLFAVSVLVVAQSSSEIPEGLMNNLVYQNSPTECLSSVYIVKQHVLLRYLTLSQLR